MVIFNIVEARCLRGFASLKDIIVSIRKAMKWEKPKPAAAAVDHRDLKRIKLQRLKPFFVCPVCRGELEDRGTAYYCASCKVSFPYTGDSFNFLTPGLRERFSIVDTDNVSSNCYGGVIDQAITDLKDGLILDCGAGSRSAYFANVVNYEIAAYPSTDVLGVGESLPFRDNAFDAVFSFAVLEHVIDPFLCAREIERVLKPGGRLLCQVPLLSPYHGYPHHYYNMTEQGLVNLFRGLEVESCTVPQNGHPVFALSWILNSWSRGLDPRERKRFESMKVKDLMKPGAEYLGEPFVKKLAERSQKELAAVNFLIARKPK
jgi:SAM-dependent methyltransferase